MKKLLPHFESKENIMTALKMIWQFPIPDYANETEAYIETLKQAAKRLGRTPLMVELPEDTAFCLWLAYGNWGNVLKAAQLPPLCGETLEDAGVRYLLSSASPDKIDVILRSKFSPQEIEYLQNICDTARKQGRAPSKKEIPENVFRTINHKASSWRNVLDNMGIPPLDTKVDRRISRKLNWK